MHILGLVALVSLIALVSNTFWSGESANSTTEDLKERSDEGGEHKTDKAPSYSETDYVIWAEPSPEQNNAPPARTSDPKPTVIEVSRQTDSFGEPVLHDALRKPSTVLARRLLKDICTTPPRLTRSDYADKQSFLACEICPAFTTGAGERSSEFRIEKFIAGRFSANGTQRIVAYYAGCEPHSGNWGGRIIYDRRATGWRLRQIDEGSGLADACLKVPVTAGREGLVCKHSSMFHGDYRSSIQYYSFTGAMPDRRKLTSTGYIAGYEHDGNRFYGWRLEPEKTGGATLYVGIEELDEHRASRVERFKLPAW